MKIPRLVQPEETLESLIASAVANAELSVYDSFIPTNADLVEPSGGAFVIPVVLPIGIPTGDGRMFEVGSLSSRPLPLPLLWQFKTSNGHDQSVVVGRIDYLDISEAGITNARGVFDINPYAREVERLIRAGFIRGVSGDLDNFSATEEAEPLSLKDKNSPKKIKNKELKIEESRLMAVTVVAMPAFKESYIMMDDPMASLESEYDMSDGEYIDGELDTYNDVALVASGIPVAPPREWFQRFNTNTPMPLTIEDNGRAYGYLALWKSDHIAYSKGQKPPRSATNYQYFRTGVVRTAEGVDVTTGSITLAGGHASMSASSAQAQKHYDDTASALIDVVAGEDKFGIWVAGALRPTASPEQIRALRASAISGDWRPINGRLELVAACSVNVPGFMTTRAMVAGGQINALVAAGVADLEVMRHERASGLSQTVQELSSRLARVEDEKKIESALSVMTDSLSEFRSRKSSEKEELDAKVLSLRNLLS